MLVQAFSLHKQGQLEDARQACERVLEEDPRQSEALHLLGVMALQSGQPLKAIESIEKAINADPSVAYYHSNLGTALTAIGNLDGALFSFDKAISLDPKSVAAHFKRGNVLLALRHFDEAIESYGRAIELNPNHAEAYNNRGYALFSLKRAAAAVDSFNAAIRINPNYADAYNNRGNALKAQRKLDEAVSSFRKTLELSPSHPFLLGTFLHTKLEMCEWSGFENDLNELKAGICNGGRVSEPFSVLCLLDFPDAQRRSAETWISSNCPESVLLGAVPRRQKSEKIRVGYFSADFRDHPVSHLTVELFEAHDRSKFEVIGFSYGIETGDSVQQRVARSFDEFMDVRSKSDLEIAQLSRDMGIDIAVDLNGLTADGRTGIFALRAAPIQVSYIGYIGTSGASYIDYVVADKTLIPPESQKHFAEKIAYLPSYQVNPSHREVSNKAFTREELGLPSTGLVYCCFNNNFKIMPDTFERWMRILKNVEESVLLLYTRNDFAKANLKQAAANLGVDPERIIFGERLPLAEHLARYRAADLFLDTWPYNAGTTASDALWAGLPVLTCLGESMVSRMAGSILNAMGLPELITHSPDEYEARAVALARDPDLLWQIRRKVLASRSTAPLFDPRSFARYLETAFSGMMDRYWEGLPPENIEIAA